MTGEWAVVLAAGCGTRMGGTPKLARPWPKGGTVLSATVAALRDSGWRIAVVLGDRHAELLPEADAMGATVVYNDHYLQGVGTSISAGVRSLPEATTAILIVLGDMPAVPANHYTALRDAWQGGAGIVVSSGGEVPGPPVLFDARYRAELESLQGDAGARAVWKRHASHVVEVRAEPEWLQDVDSPADLNGR